MYEYVWRNKWLTSGAKTIDDMIDGLQGAADERVPPLFFSSYGWK